MASELVKEAEEVTNPQTVAATRTVFEHRIKLQPIPTPTTQIVEGRSHQFVDKVEHTTVLDVKTANKIVRIAAIYDFMFVSNPPPQQLREIDFLAEKSDLTAVIVPFVSNISDQLKSELESFRLIRCVQLLQQKKGNVTTADFYYNAPLLGGQTAINEGNAYAAQLYKAIKKISHMILSDTAAGDYDQKYGFANFGTWCYMTLEQKL